MAQNYWYPPGSNTSGAVSANQGTPNTLGNAWPVKITDGTDLALVNASGELLVAASALPLPSGAATEAKQDVGNASLASIDGKVLTDAELRASPVPVSAAALPLPSGAATEAKQDDEISELQDLNSKIVECDTSDVTVSSSALPSGASTEATLAAVSNKIASSDVSEDYDYRAFTYVGATQKIDTITYKSGGSGGSTVAVQTFGYDGSDRITSITKT